MNLQNRLAHIDENWQIVEEFLVDIASRFATYITPLIPASFVFTGVLTHLEMTVWQAWIAAISIELLGLSVLSNLLAALEYNRHTAPQYRVKTLSHVAMVAFYISTIGAIVFGLKISPDAFLWIALAALTLLSLIAYLSFLMRRQQHSRAQEYLAHVNQRREADDHKRDVALAKERMEMERERLQADLLMDQMRAEAEHNRRMIQLEAERRQREMELEFRERESDIDRTLSGLSGQMSGNADNTPDKADRLAYLSGLHHATPQELSVIFGYSDRQARRDLADAGFVRNGDGRYHRA